MAKQSQISKDNNTEILHAMNKYTVIYPNIKIKKKKDRNAL